jgi:hypothetical protein
MPEHRAETIDRMAMLVIWGEKVDPTRIAEACGWKEWQPQAAWRKGEKAWTRNLDGTVRYLDHVYEYGQLKLWPKKEWLPLTLEDQVQHWIEVLSDKSEGLAQFKREGATITLHCALLANDVYDLSANIQSKLGSLDVNLGIEVAVTRTADVAA